MAAERLSMRQVKEILRQKWVLGRSHRLIAESVGVSAGSVGGAVCRATAAGLDWSQVEALDETALEAKLYGPPPGTAAAVLRPMPDPAYIHAERRRPGVTLELLHLEYLEKHPDGYRYTQFCEVYRRWAKRRRLSMRQVHRAGEKLFVDYSGKCVFRSTRSLVPAGPDRSFRRTRSPDRSEATRMVWDQCLEGSDVAFFFRIDGPVRASS